ncbi:hypothetical protein F2P79_024894 [Pimephales promelas]|nr:hypothetical protein F2P79_024894 [Pimephales promelas]
MISSSSRSQTVCSCQWSEVTRGGALHPRMVQKCRKGALVDYDTDCPLLLEVKLRNFASPIFSAALVFGQHEGGNKTRRGMKENRR